MIFMALCNLLLYLTEKPKDLDNWICKARNNVLFNLDEVPLTPEERLRRQKMNEKIINKAATRFHYDLHKVQGQVSFAFSRCFTNDREIFHIVL